MRRTTNDLSHLRRQPHIRAVDSNRRSFPPANRVFEMRTVVIALVRDGGRCA